MEVQWTGITFFMAFFGLLQLVLAGALISGRRPVATTRRLVALLFLLNGLVSLCMAILAMRPSPEWVLRWIDLFDAPTGLLFLLLAWAFLQERKPDTGRVPAAERWSIVVLATAILSGLVALLDHTWWRKHIQLWYANIPILLGYAATFAVLATKYRKHTGQTAAWYGLLLAGFGIRIVESGLIYGLLAPIEKLPTASLPPQAWVNHATALLLFVVVLAWMIRVLSERPWRSGSPVDALVLVSFAAAPLIAVATFTLQAPLKTKYVLSALSLVVLRPLIVGWTMEPSRTAQIIGLSAATSIIYVTAKALVAALVGHAFMALGVADLIALATCFLFLPALLYATTRLRSGPWNYNDASSGQMHLVTRRRLPTRAQQLITFLHDARLADQGEGVTAKDIEDATGIRPNNLAGEIRRAERRLQSACPGIDPPFVQVKKVGIRGRNVYRLNTAGIRAAYRVAGPPETEDTEPALHLGSEAKTSPMDIHEAIDGPDVRGIR